MTRSVFTAADNLPLILCHEDRFACECCECHSWRRERVLSKCREIESRLSQEVIDEQAQRDADGWGVIIARAHLFNGVAPPANDNDLATVRPPAYREAAR